MPWRRLNNPKPLPANAISLGMLIIDLDDPPRNAHDPFSQKRPPAVTPYTLENYQAIDTAETGFSISPSVGSVAQILGSKSHAVASSVQADVVTCHELDGPVDALFRQAFSQEPSNRTREWFEQALEDGDDVFFVVGFRTFTNPVLTRSSRRTTGAQASFSAPVTSAVTGIPIDVLPISVDPGVTAGGETDRECAQSFRVAGEFILEIKYCKVKFRWFSSKKVEKSSLGACRWKVSWAVRGEEDYDDDVVEVSLEAEGDE